jgi:protease-4
MMDYISQIVQSPWLIHKPAAQGFFSLLECSLRVGQWHSLNEYLSQTGDVSCYARSVHVTYNYSMSDADLPDDSIAVIEVFGVLYPWYSYGVEGLVKSALANEKIIGVVLVVDSPGGSVSYIDAVSRIISCSPKPVATVIKGMSASGCLWMTCGSGRIFVESPTCSSGSIGTMAIFIDFSGYWKKAGVVVHEVYADKSTLKNEVSRAAAEGRFDLYKKSLNELNEVFLQAVSRHLHLLYDGNNPLFQGRLFMGDAIISEGLAHQYGGLDDAVRWVYGRGIANGIN